MQQPRSRGQAQRCSRFDYPGTDGYVPYLIDMSDSHTDSPDSTFGARTITEKAGGQGSSYGKDAVAIATATNAPIPTAVAGVNKMEVLHSGVEKLTGTN